MQIVDQFQAVGEDGREYRISVVETRITTTNLSSVGPESIGGLKTYLTDDGSTLNQLSANEFQIVQTGVKVKRK